MRRRPPTSTLFPYTTLFRSRPRELQLGHHPLHLGLLAAQILAARPPRLAVRHVDHEPRRSEEHTSELQSRFDLVCRLLLEKKKKTMTKLNSRLLLPL